MQALLDSLDGLRGCTRVHDIQYRIEMTESRAADLRAIDWPLTGRRHQSKTLFGEDIRELERLITDPNAILDAAQARDERDRIYIPCWLPAEPGTGRTDTGKLDH